MRALIKGKEYNLTHEELQFVMEVWGVYDFDSDQATYIFEAPKFYTVAELSKILGITKQAIHERSMRNPSFYKLYKKAGFSYIWEWELDKWLNK